MLAKPEYFSPPNEVCCWPGRCGGATAERRLRSEDAGGSVAESYREETASRESHREEYAGGETAEEWPKRKREKAHKKNIEIAKRLFIAHNALPFLYKSSIPYLREISRSGYGITGAYGKPATLMEGE